MKKQVLVMLAALFAALVILPVGAYAADAYAILYEDGTLVFQNGAASDGRPVKATYEVDLTAAYDYAPWYNERESIRVASFADKVSPTSTTHWFYHCQNLQRMDNVSNLDTANVTDMSHMFYGCSDLTAVDLSGWNTASVTNMNWMFWGCSGLTALDFSSCDTANVTGMTGMFCRCSGLTALNLSRFDTSKVTDMSYMFGNCSALTILDLSCFDTANVTLMYHTFEGCSGLTALDLSGWNTANVRNMNWMFQGCSGLTALDLSSFDTAKVTNMASMFSGCSALKTIYASDKFTVESVWESDKMFFQCGSLVGGKGLKFNANYMDKKYARIDNPPDAFGYFTYKAALVDYKITAAVTENGNLSVTLSNPGAATLAVSYFDANGKFIIAQLQDVPANAGTVALALSADAKTARVMLLDNALCPLCAAYGADVGGAA